ncbi:hypothetical protein AOLI_G00274900 [Acnodon oligacanthus]
MVLALLLCVVGLLSVSGGTQATLILEAEPGDNVALQCHNDLIDPSLSGSGFRGCCFKRTRENDGRRHGPMTFSSATRLQVKGLLSVSGGSQTTFMMEAEPGDNVTLQCHINLQDESTHWFRQKNNSAPEFLLYRRYGHVTFSGATLLQVKALLTMLENTFQTPQNKAHVNPFLCWNWREGL